MKVVAIIPARAGSMGIRNKNIKDFCGKPLIAHAIETCKECSNIDRIILSTDSKEFADIGRKYGAEVPFMRPKEFSSSSIGIEPTLKHAYEWLKENDNYEADYLCLILPTNPLRQPFHLTDSILLAKENDYDSVVSVNEIPANHTPYWAVVEDKSRGKVRFFQTESLTDGYIRRQEFPQKCYARNDIIYVLKPKNLYESKPNLYGEKVKLYETESFYEGDLNTSNEWIIAENLYRFIKNNITN